MATKRSTKSRSKTHQKALKRRRIRHLKSTGRKRKGRAN